MCGAVTVKVDELPKESVYCHCDNCKRQSGASGTYVTIADEGKTNVDGPVKLYLDKKTDSGNPLERWFCEACGCPIYSRTSALKGKLVIKMGLFDEIPKASAEWYCKNKQGWEPNVEGATLAQKTPQ